MSVSRAASGTLNAGDVSFFTLTIDDASDNAAAWHYDFVVHQNPPPQVLEFDFSTLPSGQNLFGMLGDAEAGLIVIGKHPILKADGTYANASNTINTSQGGGPTTIGVNNQMFDPGDGAYFTFVTNPNPNFLGKGLSATEADDADNILYGNTLDVTTGFTLVSQTQGNAAAGMSILAYQIDDAPQARDFVGALGTGDTVEITAVRVFNALGQDVTGSVTIDLTGDGATVSGLHAGYKVEWDTAEAYDQVLITGTAGKFDLGAFGAYQSLETPDREILAEVTIEDFDGDTDLASFTVGIDGNHDGLIG